MWLVKNNLEKVGLVMGYAMFANRKLYYTNLVFQLQSQIDNITQQKQSLLNLSANIADGQITIDELASDPTNLSNYYEFLEGVDAYENTDDEDGGCATTVSDIGSIAVDSGYDEEDLESIAELLNTACSTEYAKVYQKQLESEENQLDLQQQRLESKLTAAQNQLEAVEEAEGDAIEAATPKYNGVS